MRINMGKRLIGIFLQKELILSILLAKMQKILSTLGQLNLSALKLIQLAMVFLIHNMNIIISKRLLKSTKYCMSISKCVSSLFGMCSRLLPVVYGEG